ADFYLGRYVPSRPGCVRLFQTSALETYEQAPDGAVLRDGRQVWPEAPVATGRPVAGIPGELLAGEEGAFLFVTGAHVRVTVTGPIMVLYRQPTLKPGRSLADWLSVARSMIPPPSRPS